MVRWVVAFLVKNEASLLNLILKVWEPGLAQAPFSWCLLQFAVFPTARLRARRRDWGEQFKAYQVQELEFDMVAHHA